MARQERGSGSKRDRTRQEKGMVRHEKSRFMVRLDKKRK